MQRSGWLHSALGSLGLVATGKRPLQSGAQYNRYFDQSAGEEITMVEEGDVTDTIATMKKIVRNTLNQTKRIAPILRGSTKLQTARNLWDFLYNHVQYTKDNPLREQLRQPVRTWRDRARGVDCDCYAIFISSVLSNLGVPHFFRIAAYNGSDYQHVYVVVPDGGKEIIIDPVLDQFNTEHPYTSKKDFTMKITMLNGVAGYANALGACPPKGTTTVQPTNPQLPAQTNTPLQQNEVVEFKPLEFLMAQTEPTAPIVSQQEFLKAQAEEQKATEQKVLWGLGLSALALTLVGAFSTKKPSLSGPVHSGRKWLSVVQL